MLDINLTSCHLLRFLQHNVRHNTFRLYDSVQKGLLYCLPPNTIFFKQRILNILDHWKTSNNDGEYIIQWCSFLLTTIAHQNVLHIIDYFLFPFIFPVIYKILPATILLEIELVFRSLNTHYKYGTRIWIPHFVPLHREKLHQVLVDLRDTTDSPPHFRLKTQCGKFYFRKRWS